MDRRSAKHLPSIHLQKSRWTTHLSPLSTATRKKFTEYDKWEMNTVGTCSMQMTPAEDEYKQGIWPLGNADSSEIMKTAIGELKPPCSYWYMQSVSRYLFPSRPLSNIETAVHDTASGDGNESANPATNMHQVSNWGVGPNLACQCLMPVSDHPLVTLTKWCTPFLSSDEMIRTDKYAFLLRVTSQTAFLNRYLWEYCTEVQVHC